MAFSHGFIPVFYALRSAQPSTCFRFRDFSAALIFQSVRKTGICASKCHLGLAVMEVWSQPRIDTNGHESDPSTDWADWTDFGWRKGKEWLCNSSEEMSKTSSLFLPLRSRKSSLCFVKSTLCLCVRPNLCASEVRTCTQRHSVFFTKRYRAWLIQPASYLSYTSTPYPQKIFIMS